MASTAHVRRTYIRQSSAPIHAAHARPKRAGRRAIAGAGASAVAALSSLTVPGAAASAALPNGDGVVLNAPIVNVAATPDDHGYWEVASDGGIFAFGDAHFHGSTGSLALNKPIVGMDATPDGKGYWEVASDGGIFAFGDARFLGSTGSIPLNSPIVGMASTPDGHGYWEVASDGGVFAFGDARFLGSAAGLSSSSPIVGMGTTPGGHGYWEVASDGDVFAFGDATFAGNAPVGTRIVAIGAQGTGYRLAGDSGSIFAFGRAPFYGSTGGQHLNGPVIGMASTPNGYVTVASDGGIFSFGKAGYYGSLGGSTVYSSPPPVVTTSGDGVTDYQRAAWNRVNMCEEGGRWNVDGSVYSGGLGFSHANWNQFNTFGYPSDAANATPDQQIRVAVAFAVAYLGSPNAAPDQNGCSSY